MVRYTQGRAIPACRGRSSHDESAVEYGVGEMAGVTSFSSHHPLTLDVLVMTGVVRRDEGSTAQACRCPSPHDESQALHGVGALARMVCDSKGSAIPARGGTASHDEPKALDGVGEVTQHSYFSLFTLT